MEQILRCIVIDDEPLARELIESYIGRTPGLTLCGSYGSPAEAIKPILDGESDVVFLDINMPTLNGIEFARLIPPQTRIIYITAYEQYALQGFRVNALDYLLKPVSYEEFLQSAGKAMDWQRMRRACGNTVRNAPSTLTVKAESRLVQMRLDSILYVEVCKDRVIFNREGGETVTSLMSMKELEEQLPAEIFMRVHRSFIVNMRRIEVVERNRIVFGKNYIPISDSKKDEFLERLRQ